MRALVVVLATLAIAVLGAVEEAPPAISESNILLAVPPPGKQLHHLVWANRGCYFWSSTDPSVASVRIVGSGGGEVEGAASINVDGTTFELNNESLDDVLCLAPCAPGTSRIAIITVDHANYASQHSAKSPFVRDRRHAVVIATEEDDDVDEDAAATGAVLRCDVWVAPVQKLDISTVVEQLAVNSTEQISVTAKDEFDNTFSSLEGLQFKWWIDREDGTASPYTVLSLSPLREHPEVELSHARREVEASGGWSDGLVLHGVMTGSEWLAVDIVDPGYHSVPKARRLLKVVELLALIPSEPVVIAPAVLFQYVLARHVGGGVQPIPMPDPSFAWSSSTPGFATVDRATGLVGGVEVGTTNVDAVDLRLPENYVRGVVHVVTPAGLEMRVRPVGAAVPHRLALGVGLPETASRKRRRALQRSWEQSTESGRPWYLVRTVAYEVEIGMLDDSKPRPRRISSGENVVYDVCFDASNTGALLSNSSQAVGFEAWRRVSCRPTGMLVHTRRHSHRVFNVTGCELGKILIDAQLPRILNPLTGEVWTPDTGFMSAEDAAFHANVTSHLDVQALTYVHDPVEIQAPHKGGVVLPFDYVGGHQHKTKLAVTGGSGRYAFEQGPATEQSPASPAHGQTFKVSDSGVVTVHSKGTREVWVYDHNNPFNANKTSVVVSPPAALEFLPGLVEVEMGKAVTLHVFARDADGRGFTVCDRLADSMEWSLVEDPHGSILEVLPPGFPDANPTMVDHVYCGSRNFRGVSRGFATVQAAYGTLRATIKVAVFPPLRLAHPHVDADGAPVDGLYPGFALALGTSACVLLQGGPDQWAYPSGGTSRLSSSFSWARPGNVSAGGALRITRDHRLPPNTRAHRQYPFHVSCRQHTREAMVFTVVNVASDAIPFPVRARVEVPVACSLPATGALRLAWTQLSLFGGAAPAHQVSSDADDDLYVVHTSQLAAVSLALYDDSAARLRYANFSTVQVHWGVANDSLVTLSPPPPTAATCALVVSLLTPQDDAGYTTVTPNDGGAAMQLLQLAGYRVRQAHIGAHEGLTRVWGDSVGYGVPALRRAYGEAAAHEAAAHWPPEYKVPASLRLQLVRDILLDPARVLLFCHPDNAQAITVVGGSGQNRFSANDTAVARVAPAADLLSVTVSPLAPGFMGLSVVDTGLEDNSPTRGQVDVGVADQIVLSVRDQVPLGADAPLTVTVVDTFGRVFPATQHRFMNLTFDTDGVTVAVDHADAPDGTRSYTLRGTALGATSLRASVANCDLCTRASRESGTARCWRIVSAPVDVEVFPRLRVQPVRLSLLPDAKYVLRVFGGPRRMDRHAFKSANDTVATIDGRGQITAADLGHAVMTVQAIGVDTATGQRGVLDQCSMLTLVAIPTGIVVSSPTSRFLVGEHVKVVARGTHGQTPLSFSGADVSFDWQLGHKETLAFQPPQTSCESHPHVNDRFAAWVTALAPGKSDVSVTVTIRTRKYGTFVFSDAHPLQASPVLHLVSPALTVPGCGKGTRRHCISRADCARLVASNSVLHAYAAMASPTAACGDPVLLLTPGARARLRTSLDSEPLTYTVVHEAHRAPAVVDIDGVGNLVASPSHGHSLVLVQDARKEQSLVVRVEVRLIAQVAMLPVPAVPVGASAKVPLLLFDSLGRQFAMGRDVALDIGVSVGSTVAADGRLGDTAVDAAAKGLSMTDVVSNDDAVARAQWGDNGTVTVVGNAEGEVVLKLWLPRQAAERWFQSPAAGEAQAAHPDDDWGGIESLYHEEIMDPWPMDGTDAEWWLEPGVAPTDSADQGGNVVARVLGDYVRVKVVNVLEPAGSVVLALGGRVAFQAGVSAGTLLSGGRWESDNPAVASVDADTGATSTYAPGRALIHYHPDTTDEVVSSLRTFATLVVVRVGGVTLDWWREGASALTNAPGRGGHTEAAVVEVVFADERGNGLPLHPAVTHGVEFSCSLDGASAAWGTAWAVGPGADNGGVTLPAAVLHQVGLRPSAHQSACVVVPGGGPSSDASRRPFTGPVPSGKLVSGLTLRVDARPALTTATLSATQDLPFRAAFVIGGSRRPGDVFPNGCVLLSATSPVASLPLYGTTDAVNVTGVDHRLTAWVRAADPASRAGRVHPGGFLDLRADSTMSFTDASVELTDKVTGQTATVCVAFDNGLPTVELPLWWLIIPVVVAAVWLLLRAVAAVLAAGGGARDRGSAGGHQRVVETDVSNDGAFYSPAGKRYRTPGRVFT